MAQPRGGEAPVLLVEVGVHLAVAGNRVVVLEVDGVLMVAPVRQGGGKIHHPRTDGMFNLLCVFLCSYRWYLLVAQKLYVFCFYKSALGYLRWRVEDEVTEGTSVFFYASLHPAASSSMRPKPSEFL